MTRLRLEACTKVVLVRHTPVPSPSRHQAIAAHDYRTAGAQLGKAMNELSTWTSGHACTSDFCYVVLGMFEYLDA